MKLLIIGGTRFLGRHLVDIALQRGHEVTLFNRGHSNPELFNNVETIIGDRDQDLSALQGRHWDAAIDTCGYFPRQVRASARQLAESVAHYSFISSISAYRDGMPRDFDESTPLSELDTPEVEQITPQTYGGLKVLCEQAANAEMPGRVLVIRPGLIVGPYDESDRFTYWPLRLTRGGEVLAPGSANAPVQFIDVRDLALWNIIMAEQQNTGFYNATGPQQPLTMGEFFDQCQQALAIEANLTWVNDDFLLQHNVAPYTDMPLWIPPSDIAFSTANCQKAFAMGLALRPLADTVTDTLAWATSATDNTALRAGLSPEQEQQLLQAWHQLAELPA